MPRSWNWLPACCRAGPDESRAGTGPAQGEQGPSAAAATPGRASQHVWMGARYIPRVALARSWQGEPSRDERQCHVRRREGEDAGRESEEGFRQVSAIVACQSPSADCCL